LLEFFVSFPGLPWTHVKDWFQICGVNVARYVNEKNESVPSFISSLLFYALFEYFMKQIVILIFMF